jgi:hypothetical protein
MKNDWSDDVDVLAAGAVCPMPSCAEVTFAYHSGQPVMEEPIEFTCPRCGLQFRTFDEDLLFHSVRREWLWAGNHSA